jgi:hypothetical protein
MQDLALEKINALEVALSQATTVQEIKKVIDAALAIELFIKQQKESREKEQEIVETILRSWRKLGEVLQAAKTAGQLDNTRFLKKGSVVASDDHGGFSLRDAGISKDLSSLAQKIASIPKEQFEQAISNAKKAGKLSKRIFSKNNTPPPPSPQPQPPNKNIGTASANAGTPQTETSQKTGGDERKQRSIEQLEAATYAALDGFEAAARATLDGAASVQETKRILDLFEAFHALIEQRNELADYAIAALLKICLSNDEKDSDE